MIDPFEILGIEPRFDVDLRKVEERYRELSRVLHPDRYVGKPAAERRLALGRAVEVGQAVRMMRDPVVRASCLLRRIGHHIDERNIAKPDPAFLMEMLELREALSEARAKRDGAAVEKLADEIRRREGQTTRKLAEGLGPLCRPENLDSRSVNVNELVPLLGELRYYQRFLEEVSSIQDDLLTSLASSPDASSPDASSA